MIQIELRSGGRDHGSWVNSPDPGSEGRVGEAHVSRTSKHLENAPWLQAATCHLFAELLGLGEPLAIFARVSSSAELMPDKPLLLWLSYCQGDFTKNIYQSWSDKN